MFNGPVLQSQYSGGESKRIMSWRPVYATELIPGLPELYRETTYFKIE